MMNSPDEIITANINYEGCENIRDRICEGDNIETYGDRATKSDVPPWITADEETQEFEKKREERIRKMRHSHVYKFVMLLSGFTNEKMEKYWTRSTGNTQTNFSTDSPFDAVATPAAGLKRKAKTDQQQQIQFHDWYVNTSWADGLVYLTPTVYAHMEEAFTAITQRHDHLQHIKLWQLVESPRIRSLFARMVAMCIRISSTLSGKKYNLDRTYQRVNLERQRLMNTFKHVRVEDDVVKSPGGKTMQPGLVFRKDDRNPRFASISSSGDIYRRMALSNQLSSMNRSKMYLN